jgi:hypothetical protein
MRKLSSADVLKDEIVYSIAETEPFSLDKKVMKL